MKYITQFKGLPKQVYYICFVRMIVGMGSLIFTFSSLLLKDVVGLNEFQAGLAMFLFAIANVTGAIVGGKLADFYGRTKIYIVCTVCTCIMYIIASFYCTTIYIIPLLLVAYFTGSACYPILSAMVADCAGEEKRAECFSLLYLAQNLGFAFGPSVGGLLFFNHLNSIFWLQSAIYIGAAVFLYFKTTDIYDLGVVKELGGDPESAPVTDEIGRVIYDEAEEDMVNASKAQPESAVTESTWKLLKERRTLLIFIGSLVIITMCYQMISFMLSLQLSAQFGLEMGSRYSGLIWTANAMTVVVGTPIIVGYTKKHHQFRNMTFALMLYAIGFGSYAFITKLPLYFIAVFIWSFGEIMISTGAGVFIAENSPASHVARFQSLYDMARSTGRGFGPPLFGLLVLKISYQQAWIVNASMCLLVAMGIYMAYRADVKNGATKH